MEVTQVVLGYAGVVVFVVLWVFIRGVTGRPLSRLHPWTSRVWLAAVCCAVGVLWPLFLPGLAVVAYRAAWRALLGVQRAWAGYVGGTRATRVRP